ncbi:chitobiase/beta-hexosaminidase C-terminal domain-containing protein [bacterium]|nr:chitobiase/beta-hexosaminidase C-terminal domain-containing protein [bacterium]
MKKNWVNVAAAASIILSASAAFAETNYSVTLVGTSNGSNIFQVAYSCPDAQAVRISERPNLIQHDWVRYDSPATQQWVWLGPSGSGSLYVFFRQTNSEVIRASIPVEVPDSMMDKIFKGTYGYFPNPGSGFDYFPYSSIPGGNVNCTVTEIGLRALSFIFAYEEQRVWSPTWEITRENLLGALNRLYTLTNYNGHAYYQFYETITGNIRNDDIPSVDNALLAACLLTIKGYCSQRQFLDGSAEITNKCSQILKPMDYSLWYTISSHRFGWTPDSPNSCDFYSNENRIINSIARILAIEYGTWDFSSNEFLLSVNSLVKPPGSYDGITVDPVSWDGSLFTYLFPAQFVREMETSYGTDSIDKVVESQIRYMENNNRYAFGISDAITPSAVGGYQQGCPPRASGNPDNDPDLGLITPGSLIMSLLSSYRVETANALYYILTNKPDSFSTSIGFHSTVSVTSDISSEVYSALDDGHAILALANVCNETSWNAFYANQSVAGMHKELYGSYPADIAPPVVWAEPIEGEYTNNVTVALNANDAPLGSGIADIWYTIDGSDPLISSSKQKYTVPIGFTNDTVLSITAIDSAGNEAFPQRFRYTIVPEPGIIFLGFLYFMLIVISPGHTVG